MRSKKIRARSKGDRRRGVRMLAILAAGVIAAGIGSLPAGTSVFADDAPAESADESTAGSGNMYNDGYPDLLPNSFSNFYYIEELGEGEFDLQKDSKLHLVSCVNDDPDQPLDSRRIKDLAIKGPDKKVYTGPIEDYQIPHVGYILVTASCAFEDGDNYVKRWGNACVNISLQMVDEDTGEVLGSQPTTRLESAKDTYDYSAYALDNHEEIAGYQYTGTTVSDDNGETWREAAADDLQGDGYHSHDFKIIKVNYRKQFTVTYKDGLGQGAFPDQSTIVLRNDATPAFDGEAERNGYTFEGWDKEIADTVTEDAVYTATWKEIPAEPQKTTEHETPATTTPTAATEPVTTTAANVSDTSSEVPSTSPTAPASTETKAVQGTDTSVQPSSAPAIPTSAVQTEGANVQAPQTGMNDREPLWGALVILAASVLAGTFLMCRRNKES